MGRARYGVPDEIRETIESFYKAVTKKNLKGVGEQWAHESYAAVAGRSSELQHGWPSVEAYWRRRFSELGPITVRAKLTRPVVRAVGKGGEIVHHRNIRMLHARGQPRFAQKSFVRVGASGDLRTNDLDDANRAEEDVLDFVDIAHPAAAEALDDAVLAVDRRVVVSAKKIGDGLAAVRAGAKRLFNLRVAAEASHVRRLL